MTTIKSLFVKKILNKKWFDFKNNPVINPPFPDFLLADPVVLQPNESPDGMWHLFAHGVLGLYHYSSLDGLSWSARPRFLGWFRLRPFIYKERGVYYLFYEKMFNVHRFPYYDSRLEMTSSKDLISWSKPTVIISPSKPWHQTLNKVGNIGSPWIVKIKDKYRLHYSSGLVYLPECRFCEPKNISYATASSIVGPYKMHDKHINSLVYKKSKHPSSRKNSYMWPPSIRLFKMKDKYLGLMTMYFFDKLINKSRTDIRLVSSKSGLSWSSASVNPIISPDKPWKKSHVYVGFLTKVGKQLRIYYNARNGWFWGREAICLSVTEI